MGVCETERESERAREKAIEREREREREISLGSEDVSRVAAPEAHDLPVTWMCVRK